MTTTTTTTTTTGMMSQIRLLIRLKTLTTSCLVSLVLCELATGSDQLQRRPMTKRSALASQHQRPAISEAHELYCGECLASCMTTSNNDRPLNRKASSSTTNDQQPRLSFDYNGAEENNQDARAARPGSEINQDSSDATDRLDGEPEATKQNKASRPSSTQGELDGDDNNQEGAKVRLECHCKTVYDSREQRLKCKNMSLAEAKLNRTMSQARAIARSRAHSGPAGSIH